jgi:hypothetical protein
MFISELDVVMRREQYKDLLREAEIERLIRVARLRPAASGRLYRKVSNWLGTQLVNWSRSLLHSDTIPARSEQPTM